MVSLLLVKLELLDLLLESAVLFLDGVTNDLGDHLLVRFELLWVRQREASWLGRFVLFLNRRFRLLVMHRVVVVARRGRSAADRLLNDGDGVVILALNELSESRTGG